MSTGKIQQLDTGQHSYNVAAASAATSCPNASSLIRGLPYHESAQDLTDEFLEAAGQHKVKWQYERKQRPTYLPSPGAAKLAYDARCFRPMAGFAALKEGQDDVMISLNGSFDQVTYRQKQRADAFTFNNILSPRAESGGDNEWVTLNNKPVLFATREEPQRQEEQEKEVDVNSIVVTSQRIHTKDFAYKDDVVDEEKIQGVFSEQETVSKSLHPKTEPDAKKPVAIDEKVTGKKAKIKKATTNSKKTITAVKRSTAFDMSTTASSKAPNTPIKRRGGRPIGYRKQANGKFAFSDGSTVQSKSESSNDGGAKKRKAPVDDAPNGGSNKKLQRKGKDKGKGSEAAVDEEGVVEKEGEGSQSEEGQRLD